MYEWAAQRKITNEPERFNENDMGKSQAAYVAKRRPRRLRFIRRRQRGLVRYWPGPRLVFMGSSVNEDTQISA